MFKAIKRLLGPKFADLPVVDTDAGMAGSGRHKQVVVRFDNGYGVSVIHGPGTVGRHDGVEVAVKEWNDDEPTAGGRIAKDTPITADTPDDVLGGLSADEAVEICRRVARLPRRKR